MYITPELVTDVLLSWPHLAFQSLHSEALHYKANHKYSTIQGILQDSTVSGYPVVYSGWPGSPTAGVWADVVGFIGVKYLVPAY